MSQGTRLLSGLIAAMALSWLGFVVAPLLQLGGMQQTVTLGDGLTYPIDRSGLAKRGAEVYRANGCNACHTQQVRPDTQGSDLLRGWGRRRTVAYDYLFDHPVMLGSQRLGPDLANVGMRLDANTLLLRLYAPQILVPGSAMPPYRYLFEKRKTRGRPSPDALKLPPGLTIGSGFEIVPRPEAQALVAYLRSLRIEGNLYETVAPAPPKPRKLKDVSIDSKGRTTGSNFAGSSKSATNSEPRPPAK